MPVDIEPTSRNPRTNLTWRDAAKQVRYELVSLDSDSLQFGGPPRLESKLNEFTGDLPAGALRSLESILHFDRPGYYRVMARVVSEAAGREDTRGDTAVLNTASETLYLVVDENGGRLTEGFDPSVPVADRARPLLHGSYGPVVPIGSSGSSVGSTDSPSTAALFDENTMTGRIVYHNNDTGGKTGVKNVSVTVRCWDPYQPSYITQTYTGTDSNGYFSAPCPPPRYAWEVTTALSNAYIAARGGGGVDAGTYFSYHGYSGPNLSPELEIGNRYAAHVFMTVTDQAPDAFSRFERSRGRVIAWVSDGDPNHGIHYDPNTDRIITNYTGVFGQSGVWTTTHEYGHAYQANAIEYWGSAGTACTNGVHGFTEEENLPCSYREGFADFFGTWIAGEIVDTQPHGGDYGLENNLDAAAQPTNVFDGVRVEGAIAAFLYDLVDGAGEPDGIGNTVGASESVDDVSFPASWLANVMDYCRVSELMFDMALDGWDQMVYCLEGDLTAHAESQLLGYSSWRSFPTVVPNTSQPPGYSKAAIRRLWKYNLYGALE